MRAFGLAAVVAVGLLTAVPEAGQQAPTAVPAVLLKPAALKEKAPSNFRALFDTTVGMFVIEVHRDWAPNGADRFYNLVKHGFYDKCAFFRVIPKFVAQFGINGNPAVAEAWRDATIPADRALKSNTRGKVTFAMLASDTASRSTQVFINLGDNSRLDIDGFAPFGEVTSSMVLVELIFGGYGEGPDQALVQTQGNAFLVANFPKMDFIKKAQITE